MIVFEYFARLGPTRSTFFWAKDEDDADAKAARIGGVLSLQRTGVEMYLPEPERETV